MQPARLLCPRNSPGKSGLPFPSPGDLTDPGIESRSPALQADSLMFESHQLYFPNYPGWPLKTQALPEKNQALLLKCPITVCVHTLSHVLLFAMPWILARQAPLSVGLSWQEHWSRLPFPSSGDIPHLGIKPVSPVLAGEPLSTREAPLISCSVNMYPMYDGWMVPILPCWSY